MMADIMLTFILTILSFGLFFFSTPYWTGAGMEDAISNGLYRVIYYRVSGIGFQMYKLIEHISNKVAQRIKRPPNGTFRILLNTLLYIAMVYFGTKGYEFVMISVIGNEIGVFNTDMGSTYAKYENAKILLLFADYFADITSVRSFFYSLREAFIGMLIYIAGTMIFFSVMYGMLEHKVKKLFALGDRQSDCAGEAKSLREIPRSICAKMVDFIDNITLFLNFKQFSVCFVFLLAAFAYSVILVYKGTFPELKSFLMNLLDEIGVFEVLIGFGINLAATWLAGVLCVFIYQILPIPIQNAIDKVSEQGKATVREIRKEREHIARKIDSLYSACHRESIHKMHLDDYPPTD